MPIIEMYPVDRRKRESTWLSRHAANKTSQHGQDGIIEAVFDLIGTESKACCEFGAWDGKRYSNTYTLIAEKGWDGYLVEANATRCKQIVENHNNNPKAHPINAWVKFEGEDSIDYLLEKEGAPHNLDLMVIDIDGNDYHVWESMTKYRPRVVAIEYNPTIPNDVVFVQDKDWNLRQGNSILALKHLADKKGYKLVSTHGDAFFVLDELFPKFNIDDNSIDALHYLGQRELKIFHGYDGKMWTAGHRKVGWQNSMSFEADTIQVVPEERRKFST